MTELEKLEAGLEYCFLDQGVAARKERALTLCREFNSIDPANHAAQLEVLKNLFGTVPDDVSIQPDFNCDYGLNIHVGHNFIVNYNVTILDIAPVHIGDYAMIGPNTLITTVNHPLSAQGRRERKAQAKPVIIGDAVWIGGNCVILPGVTIGSNVVIAAGAVVTKNISDNSVVAGVPARKIKTLETDIDTVNEQR